MGEKGGKVVRERCSRVHCLHPKEKQYTAPIPVETFSQPALANQDASTPAQEMARDDEQNEHANDLREDLLQRRADIVRQVRAYAHATFDELHAASRKQTEELVQGAEHIPLNEKEIRDWEDFCAHRLTAMQESAHSLFYDQFMDRLLDECNKGVISVRVVQDLSQKFRDEHADYKARESYIQSILPKRIEEWRKVKRQRDRLLKHRNLPSLTNAQVLNLKLFLNEKSFLDLKYPERKGLADAVEAALTACDQGMELRHEEARKELEGYVHQGFMHASKVGSWMLRIFKKNSTPEEIDLFMKKVVRPNALRWEEARDKFLDLEETMDKNGTPRGMPRISLEEFLLKTYKQKTSYLSLLELRLEDIPEKNQRLAALKLSIRHNLDTEDWEGAEEELRDAMRIGPDDRELRSMRAFIRNHRPNNGTKQKENPDPTKILEDMRTMIHAMPTDLQWLYTRAAMDGPLVFNQLLRLSYNRVWVHEHGYATQAADVQNAEDEHNKTLTRHYMEEGHSRLFERNIIDGDTSAEGAIRDKCTKPQMLYVGSMGKEATLRKIRKNAEDWGFGYWTTLIPDGVDFSIHRSIVKEQHHRLKSGMRMLDRMGYRYTSSGEPVKKASAIPKAKKPTRSVQETNGAMAA